MKTPVPSPPKRPNSGFTRVPFNHRCTVRRGAEVVEGLVCNLSVLGVYVTFPSLPNAPEVGEELDIEVFVPGLDHPLKTAATVTWQNTDPGQHADDLPPGCGLRFDALSLNDQERLGGVVSEYLLRAPEGTRPGPRVPYLQLCDIVYGGVSRRGLVCNVSEWGIYVSVDPAPASGQRASVAFWLPGDPRPFEAEATVTWQNLEEPGQLDDLPQGCGLRFDDLPVSERARLRAVVEDYCSRSSTGTGTETDTDTGPAD
jgi:hypothetical protein